jgi:electron transfer flavoprotein beta subunit
LDPSGIVVNRRRGRIFINREEYILQPGDRCALEAALRIKDTTGAEAVALPRGPLPNDDVLRQAMATGADRAVYLTGDGFKGADDAVAVRVLAATVERLGGADLVLTGATTMDTGQGQLGLRLAEALDWPHVVNVWQVEAAKGQALVVRQDGTDYVSVQVDLPAVVMVPAGALKPRYPNGVRLVNIYKGVGEIAEALVHWDVADLVDEETLKPLVERRGQDFPPERERGARVGGTPAEMAQAAADALRQRMQG